MRTAFPSSDYYADSATPRARRPASGLAELPPAARRARGASHVHHDPFDRVGSWLCPYSPSGGLSQAPAGHHAQTRRPGVERAAIQQSGVVAVDDPGPPGFGSFKESRGFYHHFAFALPFGLASTHAGVWQFRPAVTLSGRLTSGARSRALAVPSFSGSLHQPGAGIPAGTDEMFVVLHLLSHGTSWRRQDFVGFSYGFRPGRKPHDALDALAYGINRKRVNWVLDADFRDYFSSLDHRWLERFLEHRIADRRVLRLIQKWLAAGVIEEGTWTAFEDGVPQGASASPLLANVYLHYVFDLWAHQWRTRHAHGDVMIVRFADDFVVGFEHRDDAERFWADLRERLAQFSLELNAEKTRLIEFGRCAARNREACGLGRPETFQVSRLHARVREDQEGAVQAEADYRLQTGAREAAGQTARNEATHASAHPRTGALASQCPARALPVLRGARQQQGALRLPRPDHPELAVDASASQPARPAYLGADEAPG